VLVVDPDVSAGEYARATGVDWVGEVDKVGGLIDGAIVTTPASTHGAVVRKILSKWGATLPVLCEKPLTTCASEAVQLAKDAPNLFVDHTWRYHPGVILLGEIARSGVLGTVLGLRTTRTNWTSPRTDVDAVWNLVPHDLTLGLEILGQIPPPRAALCEMLQGRAVSMWALLGAEPWLVLESSNRFADKRREIRVHGTEAVAVLPSVESPFINISFQGSGLTPERVQEVAVPQTNPLDEVVGDFADFLAGGPRPKCDAHEGAAVVAMIETLRGLAGLDAAK
jgi:predicted dehydrogenase